MLKVSYEEAREWFWVRTAVWFVPCAIVSVMAFFAFSASPDMAKALPFATRAWVSLGAGMLAALFGVLTAFLTLQFPWMMGGWRIMFLINGPVSGAMSAIGAFAVCGLILSMMQNDAAHPPTPEVISASYALMQLGIGEAAFWGFIFGSWFALRRDKYFIEAI